MNPIGCLFYIDSVSVYDIFIYIPEVIVDTPQFLGIKSRRGIIFLQGISKFAILGVSEFFHFLRNSGMTNVGVEHGNSLQRCLPNWFQIAKIHRTFCQQN